MQRRVYIFNPKQYDYLTATIIEGLNELGIPYSAIRQSNYSSQVWKDKSWRQIGKNDILLDCSGSSKVRRFLRWFGHPNVFRVDGGDQVLVRMEDRDLYRGLFKRELPSVLGPRGDESVWPLPFGAEKRYFRTNLPEKDLFLTFMMDKKNKPFRSIVEANLLTVAKPNWFVGSTNERAGKMSKGSSLPTPKYNEILSRSCISVSVMGAGYDCARYWEVPAVKAVLLSQTIPLQIPHPFKDGETAVFFETIDELLSKVKDLESGKLDWERIALAGHEHLVKYHTTQSRAAFLLNAIEEALNDDRRADWDKIENGWGRVLFGKTWNGQ